MQATINKVCFSIALIFASQFTMADAEKIEFNQDFSQAQKVISDYKQLRSSCLKTQGLERKQCFAKLEAINEKYTTAKRLLQPTESASNAQNNVHLVSFL